MKSNTWGDNGRNGRLFDSQVVDFDDDPSTVWSRPTLIENYDGISLQLVSGGARPIIVLEGDNVDAGTQTWVLKAGHFSDADIGGIFTVAGSVAVDGDYEIATVVNSYTVTTVEVPPDDETLDPDEVTVDMVQHSPFGTWTIRVSNTYCAGSASEVASDGSPWTPLDNATDFVPVISAVSEQYVEDADNSANQGVQCAPFMYRAFQVGFTPSAGAGPISVFGFAKGNR